MEEKEKKTVDGWHQERCPACGSLHVDVFTVREGTGLLVTLTCTDCGEVTRELRKDFGC